MGVFTDEKEFTWPACADMNELQKQQMTNTTIRIPFKG